MRIIPVIDLKDRQVVHARQGQRDQYQAISTPLCPTADLDSVLQAYLGLYAFDTFYVADLNAIQGDPAHQAMLTRLLQRYPKLSFWIDSGYQAQPTLFQNYANYTPVLGSESYQHDNVQQLAQFQKRYILSLDFAGAQALGAPELFSASHLWPEQVIIMNLQQVGSQLGPDFARLTAFQRHYPQHQFIAAGGIRHQQDLVDLEAHGIHTALIASALHAGTLSL